MARQDLCAVDELPEGAVRVFEVDEDVRIAVARSGTAVFAVEDRCSHDDGAFGIAGDRCAECGMIDDPSAAEMAQEIADLIAGDGVPGADVDASALFHRDAPVDADHVSVGVEQRTAGVAGVD